MGHHWPGADWPETNDENRTDHAGRGAPPPLGGAGR